VASLEGPLYAAIVTGGLDDLGMPDASLFVLPAFLDRPSTVERISAGRLVEARRWRVVRGVAERRGAELAIGADRGARPRAEIAWRPSPTVREARTLRLVLRGPDDLSVELPGVGARAVLGPDAPAVRDGAGFRLLDLPLPDGWYDRLKERGQEIVIVLAWPEDRPERSPARIRSTSFRITE
jgi:hypothetical protein